jgi:hypothetical protein
LTPGQCLGKIGKEFNLPHERRENRSMTIYDLQHQIEETICTTEKTFNLG